MGPPRAPRPTFSKGTSADNPDRAKAKGDTFKRDKATIKRIGL
jgi:nuclear GTP-binding protein